MSHLDKDQVSKVIMAFDAYLGAPSSDKSKPLSEAKKELDGQRRELIAQELSPLVKSFIEGKEPLAKFKSAVDSLNKRNNHWGFRGMKGQMFFNMLLNCSKEEDLSQQLRSVLVAPKSELAAAECIRKFSGFVRKIRDEWVTSGGSARSTPRTNSIPFFLSYFWQIQMAENWPVYYTNSVQVMSDWGLWQATGELDRDYISYKQIHDQLVAEFEAHVGRKADLYEVEHVFWVNGGMGREDKDQACTEQPSKPRRKPAKAETEAPVLVCPINSYVPPMVQFIGALARNTDEAQSVAQKLGTDVSTELERRVHAAFTILGYEAELKGHGKGRVADGTAVEPDARYAIIWDAKASRDGYRVGTDDRAWREYIENHGRDLKRQKSVRNLYLVIISSSFAHDVARTAKELKMQTGVNEVIFMEADALLTIVDAKLRNPLGLTLGADGLQHLFSASGLLTAEDVKTFV